MDRINDCRAAAQPLGRRRRPPQAFTLIELLIVLAIIGVLVAIALPAVQSARESARRTQCLSNLHEIGVALQGHHAVYRAFPVGCLEWRPPKSVKGERQLAWSAFLLPFIDQDVVFDQLDLEKAFDDPANQAAAATVLEVYLCPSSRRLEKRVDGRGACDYGGIYGERITGPNNPPKGTMLFDRPVSIAMIRDGAAQTAIVSEDAGWVDGQWINGRNIFDQAFAINRAPPYENDIRSDHPAGANLLLADGAARFVHESIDLKVLAALCTRAGGEPMSEF
jgi:prepilin-type N-terminal cleavage/methylation domain-containing protein